MAYTCPMHPEVRQQGPGDCPICGMALEPAGVPAEEDENPELSASTVLTQNRRDIAIRRHDDTRARTNDRAAVRQVSG